MRNRETAISTFWRNAKKTESCWIWQGTSRARGGYGYFTMEGRRYRAHRLAWILTNGAIPKNQSVLHRCDNPPCIKPEHLFIGTQRDNIHDAISKGRLRTSYKGEEHPQHRFTEAVIRYIRSSPLSSRELAEQLETGHGYIAAIRRREFWSHVP